MNFWGEIADTFLNKIGGSYVIVSILAMAFIFYILFLIRASKVVFTAVMFVFMFFVIKQGILPSWLLFIIIALAGVIVSKGIMDLFFSSRG